MAAQLTDFDQFRNDRWGPIPPDYPSNQRALWSPYDNVHDALVLGVESVTRQLVIAMYGFTDDALAEAVEKKLADPDIHCQITLDKSQAGGTVESRMLHKWGLLDSNSVAVGTSEHSAIMHRKILVADATLLFTGSTNWSVSAETKQDNELTITQDARRCADALIVLALEHTKARTQMLRKGDM